MWNFYDELCTGIPSGIRIDDCIINEQGIMVHANGNIGLARTMGAEGIDLAAAGKAMVGTFLRDAANHMKWNNLLQASIGVAAMNAYYNCAGRILPVNTRDAFQGQLDGTKVAIIGEMPALESRLRGSCDLTVLPLPESSELGAEYDAALSGDFVFISGDALINKTLPALLSKVGEQTKVSLAGVSVPAAPVLFAFGNPIHNLSGVFARFDSVRSQPTAPFSIDPVKPEYLHESPEVTRYENSPYKATKFNSAFNPWCGKDYDPTVWSPIFKG